MTPPKFQKYESRKKNHADMVKDSIKHQNGERHFPICYSCQLNCVVARNATDQHWANIENIEPRYTAETCPKAENLDRLIKAKAMKRFRGKR